MKDDLISRKAAIDAIGNVQDYDDGMVWEALSHAQRDVALLPSAQKKGKWVIEPDRTVMHCNSCGWAFEYYAGLEEEWNYCPHCGARME